MADAYLKVKDNGAEGLSLEREEADTSVGELGAYFNKAVNWDESTLSNKGTGSWVNNNGVVNYISAASGAHFALAPYVVNEGDVIRVVGNNPYISAVFFVNEEDENYILISEITYSGSGKRNYDDKFTIEPGVSHLLINKYGSGTVSCEKMVVKTDKTLTIENAPADAKATGASFSELLAMLKN